MRCNAENSLDWSKAWHEISRGWLSDPFSTTSAVTWMKKERRRLEVFDFKSIESQFAREDFDFKSIQPLESWLLDSDCTTVPWRQRCKIEMSRRVDVLKIQRKTFRFGNFKQAKTYRNMTWRRSWHAAAARLQHAHNRLFPFLKSHGFIGLRRVSGYHLPSPLSLSPARFMHRLLACNSKEHANFIVIDFAEKKGRRFSSDLEPTNHFSKSLKPAIIVNFL